MSIKPAVHMAPLYTRSLFQAMTGQWDGVVSELDTELTEADLMYWKEHLPSMRGKSWTRTKAVYHIVEDAILAGAHYDIVIGHTAEEQHRMEENDLSSCLRETKNAKLQGLV